MAQSAQPAPSPRPAGGGWPHRLALLTTAATLVLIFAGGLVTSLKAGLAVPDWPTTFGYNMFLFPFSRMVGDVFFEHTHRLLGSAVGILTVLTAAALWVSDRRIGMRWLGGAALLLVILQGVLGGLRVVLVEHDLAIVHAITAQLFFGLMACIAALTARPAPAGKAGEDPWLRRLALLLAVLLYAQTVFGVLLRHTGRSLDLHLLLGVLVLFLAVYVAARALKQKEEAPAAALPAQALAALVFAQVFLGVLSWLVKYTPMEGFAAPWAIVLITSAHVAGGSLLIAASLILCLRLYRAGSRGKERAEGGLLAREAAA